MLKKKISLNISAVCLGISGVSMVSANHPFEFINLGTAPEMLGGNPRVNIYDRIGATWWEEGVTAKAFVEQLSKIDDAADIDCHISTDGGCTKEGTVMYNALVNRKGATNTIVDGYAMSMGSVLAMAGKNSGGTTKMVNNGFLFLHKPITDMRSANASDLRARADDLDKVEGALLLPYTQASGKSDDEVRALLVGNTWMSATEALEMGFIDEILNQDPIEASFDIKHVGMYGEVPQAFLDLYAAKVDDEDEEGEDKIDDVNDDDEEENVDDVNGDEEEEEDKPSEMSASEAIKAERKRCADIQSMCDKNGLPHKASMFIQQGFSLSAASDFVIELKAAVDEEIVNRSDGNPPPKVNNQSGNWEAAYKSVAR